MEGFVRLNGCHHYESMALNGIQADVVVVAYNSADTIRACVEPLAADPRLRVTIVDNASRDDPADALAGLDVTLVTSSENRGFGAGCNLGWRAGRAPNVVFLNPDARIDAEGVRRLVTALGDDEVGLAAPKILNDDGTIQNSQHRFPKHGTTWMQALLVNRLAPNAIWAHEDVVAPDAYEHVARPDWVGGACIAVRRELLERLDGFDERFFMYCEDMDLCRRLHDLGHTVLFLPDVVASHEGGRSAPAPRRSELKYKSRIIYARIHSTWVGYADYVVALTFGLLGRVVVDFRNRTVHAHGLMGVARGVMLTFPLMFLGGN